MRLRLRWTDQNPKAHDTLIYRSDSLPTSDPVGEPLVRLSKGETFWDDTTVIRGNVYWYTFVVENKTNRVVSSPVQVTALPRTGHGPQSLTWGDYDWGIYGTINPEDFINHADLAKAVNAPGAYYSTTALAQWVKFSRNGKTLFVPRRAITYSVSWSQLYSAGLVFGVDGPGPHSNQLPEVNQRKTIQIGGDEYIVRLPTGFDDRNNPSRLVPEFQAGGFTLTNGGPYRKYSELADLFWSLYNQFPTDRTRSMSGIGYLTYPYTPSAGPIMQLQEINVYDKNGYSPVAFSSSNDVQPYTKSTSVPPSSTSNSYGWWPVLELVESLEVVL